MLKKLLSLTSLLLLVACSTQTTTSSGNEPFVVGMECGYAPFNWLQSNQDEDSVFVESSNGYCKGYDVTVAKHIADELDRPLIIKVVSWEGLIPALNSNSIDAIIAGMSYRPDRAEQVAFSDPYYFSDYVLIVPKDSPFVSATSLDDFKGAKIVGQLGTNYDTIIDQMTEVDHLPALNSYPLIVNALNTGAADGAPAEKPTAESIIATNPNLTYVEFEEGLGFTQDEEVTTEVSIALRKQDTQLLEEINTILNNLDQNQRDTWMKQAIESPQE